jgi:hypothetical protein
LEITQLFTARSVLGDPPQTQMLFQHLNLEPRILQLARVRFDLPRLGIKLCKRLRMAVWTRLGEDGHS